MTKPALVALVALAAACRRESAVAPEAIAHGAPPLVHMDNLRVDAKPLAPCAIGSTCEAELVLTALGRYEVNEDYPFKFIADEASDVTVAGAKFKRSAPTQGTMTVRFTRTKPGPAKLVGTFKLGVCDGDICESPSPKIALDVSRS